MAKKKAVTVNKTQAVLDYLKVHPEATATIVIPVLAKEGITVSQGLVNNTRSRLKKVGTTKKAAKKAVVVKKKRVARKKATRKNVTRPSVSALSAKDLFEAKKLVDKLGSLDGARKAIETLEQLR